MEVPTLGDAVGTPRPKYSFEVNALVIHRGDKAYVVLEDEAARAGFAHYSDVRLLTDEEGRKFEESLPYPMPPQSEKRQNRVGLGDVISRLAKLVGLEECGDCRKRRQRLNRIPVWGWWARE
jgi:hypothetical protein